jgi:hypothetical protein
MVTICGIKPLKKGWQIMFGIQELIEHTKEQRKIVECFMDENAYFDSSEASIFNNQKRSISREISETLRKVSLAEFLSKGNTAAGGQYLVPDFVSAKIYSSLQTHDVIPLISADVITPKSDTVTVTISLTDGHVSARGYAQSTADIVKANITLQKVAANIAITNEMLEDQEYGLLEWHLGESAKSLTTQGNGLALAVLKSPPDGRGSTVSLNAGSGTTTPANVGAAMATVGCGQQSSTQPGFIADTMICTTEAWGDAIGVTAGQNSFPPQKPGFNAWFMGLDVLFCNNPSLYGTFSSNRMTACVSPVFSKDYALLTARKSWGRIEKYSKPIEDLAGAVLTGRQDSVSLNKDAICALTET